MVPAAEAEAKILDLVCVARSGDAVETIPLPQALGRVLAAPVTGALDVPHWDNSAMDGYAVCYADVQSVTAEHSVTLTLTETIPAGKAPTFPLQPGQAARIFTGSMLPVGADTVVIQEVTTSHAGQVTILERPQLGQFVRHQGSFYQAGESLMPTGLGLGGPEIAVLAAAQCSQVSVFRQPRVAILSTGDELVPLTAPLHPGQIVDSNQYALTALVQQAGGVPLPMGIIPDQPEALSHAIQSALTQADIIVSSGGVSVGDFDYVDHVLADLGATLHLRSVAVQPGKPLTVATFPRSKLTNSQVTDDEDRVLYFGLPGNPVSALVSFWRFVEPALRKRSGLSQGWSPVFVTASTRDVLKAGGKRETYLWGNLSLVNGHFEFRLAQGSHSSGNLINLAGTNALAVVPVGTTTIAADTLVNVMLVGRAAIKPTT